jgi:hypothetical protein
MVAAGRGQATGGWKPHLGSSCVANQELEVNTTAVPGGAASVGEGRSNALRQHLESCLAELWADAPAPVWVADALGQIVYANPTAKKCCNGTGLREAANRIAETIGGARISRSVAPDSTVGGPIDVAPLLDGSGQRLGWLAIGPARE